MKRRHEDPEAYKRDYQVARGIANKNLQAAHREEFNVLLADAMRDLGWEFRTIVDDQGKAAKKIKALLAEYPGLASELAALIKESE